MKRHAVSPLAPHAISPSRHPVRAYTHTYARSSLPLTRAGPLSAQGEGKDVPRARIVVGIIYIYTRRLVVTHPREWVDRKSSRVGTCLVVFPAGSCTITAFYSCVFSASFSRRFFCEAFVYASFFFFFFFFSFFLLLVLDSARERARGGWERGLYY